MNSNEPLMENAREYWKIIDNLRDSNELLEKELNQLRAVVSNSAITAIPDTDCQTTPHNNNHTLTNNNFTLIVNHLNNVIYADKNGLKLWNAISPDMIPKVNFASNSQITSQERTKSTFLVLPEDKSRSEEHTSELQSRQYL